MRNKDWIVDTGIIAQGSADQGFEGIHYYQFMRLHKEAFEAIIQSNVEPITENFENIGVVASSKLIKLQKSLSSALLKKILKLEAFKDIKQHTVSTTVTKSQMAIKYLKAVSAMLAVVSALREVDLDHLNYVRRNTY